ncbi:epimerase [Nocardioides sp. Root122]|uniref:NAD-dependent epimerase/dehydratase family protein n=1 Tax=Nocardioides TaxID=1839 RepID=UPI000703A606|nr:MULTISPECIES: NAD(P)-dependent oxidoreductase [Nocardioides]KQV63379.1 epimerase [Nocardioides sp. Root122]MCK9825519.1 NAD(P)-dependent oxidoreductase [Nocardioides cavernae]
MTSPIVVVTGANGLVGSHVVAALGERGATVRAVVRRVGAAPDLPGVEEHVGDFADPVFAETVVAGADALVTTVHPLGGDHDAQRRVGLDGTLVIATAAADAGVPLLVHVSTAAVYDRSPGAGDVSEGSALVDDDAGDYPVIKRDVDAALDRLEGATRVLLRPPAILGQGESSVWNSVRPAQLRDSESERRAQPDKSFAWVHVTDLAALAADLATGAIPAGSDISSGPLAGGCTPVNVASEPATQRDYVGTVARALSVEPVWEGGEAWTGQILADRARSWGWAPAVSLADALAELEDGVRAL